MNAAGTTNRSVGLKDVAARARVSPKTVSNVVNGTATVTPGTKERVEKAIDELGYRPNLAARNLRRGRTGLLTLAVPELDLPYFAELARNVVDAAYDDGYTVLIDQTGGDAERERYVVNGLGARMADGILFSPLALDRAELERRADRTPLVMLGERVPSDFADHVAVDNVAAARAATGHLVELGRRRIAAIGAQPGSDGTAEVRIEGYRTALAEGGLPVDEGLIAAARHYHRRDGAEAMGALLDLPEPPDAVFCCNDLLALGALRTLRDRGARVPDDVAVIGFDGIDEGLYSVPSLTTIVPDTAGIARTAIALLQERIASVTIEPREVTVPYDLRVRESTSG